MAIEVTCPACGRQFALAESLAGKTGRCPCGQALAVPSCRPAASTTVECVHCGMASRPGAVCEWCRQPFARPRPVYDEPATPSAEHGLDYARGPAAPAPVAVVVIRILMLLGLVLGWLLVAALLLFGMACSFIEMEDSVLAGAVLGCAGLMIGAVVGLGTWLWSALGKASTVAWWIYTVLLGLDLVVRPIHLLVLLLAAATPTEFSVTGESPAVIALQIAFAVLDLAISIAVMVFWQQRPVKRWYGVG